MQRKTNRNVSAHGPPPRQRRSKCLSFILKCKLRMESLGWSYGGFMIAFLQICSKWIWATPKLLWEVCHKSSKVTCTLYQTGVLLHLMEISEFSLK